VLLLEIEMDGKVVFKILDLEDGLKDLFGLFLIVFFLFS